MTEHQLLGISLRRLDNAEVTKYLSYENDVHVPYRYILIAESVGTKECS